MFDLYMYILNALKYAIPRKCINNPKNKTKFIYLTRRGRPR